jgi:hypothetical protein
MMLSSARGAGLSGVGLAGRQQIRSVIGDHAGTPVTPSLESAAVTVPAGR